MAVTNHERVGKALEGAEVEKSKLELLRVRFDEQVRTEKRKSAATGRFDFVLANPPFNVNAADAANCEVRNPKCESRSVRQSKSHIRHSRRLWIQLFHSALNPKGRAGFAMADSIFDAGAEMHALKSAIG